MTDKIWINEAFGAEVTVYDAQGRVVMRQVFDGPPIDVSFLPDGNYYLRSVYDGRVATGQFVKIVR